MTYGGQGWRVVQAGAEAELGMLRWTCGKTRKHYVRNQEIQDEFFTANDNGHIKR